MRITDYPLAALPLDGSEALATWQYGRQVQLPVSIVRNNKGDPGGNVMNVGLFIELAGMAIPAGVNRVRTSGWSTPGVGGGDYVHNPAEAPPANRGPNLVDNPDNLTGAGWAGQAGPATATFDGTDTTIVDSTDSYARWERTFTGAPARYTTLQWLVKKTAPPADDGTTYTPIKAILRLRFTGGTAAVQYDVLIDQALGTVYPGNRASASTSAAFHYGLRDGAEAGAPGYWLVWVTGVAPSGSTATLIRIYAANGPNNSSSSAATGTVVGHGLDLYSGISPYYVPVDNARTQAAVQDGRLFKLSLDQTITPFMTGCAGDGITDDTIALKAASAFASNTKCVSFNWGGSFGISEDFTWGRSSGLSATRVIDGELRLVCLTPRTYALTLLNMAECKIGDITIAAMGGQNYTSRSTWVGVRFDGSCRELRYGRIDANNMLYASLLAASDSADNFNFSRGEHVHGDNVGSGSSTQGGIGSLYTDWAWVSDPVNVETFTQRTRLRLVTQFPEQVTQILGLNSCPVQLEIGDYPYTIKSVDRTDPANILVDVYPRLPAAQRVVGSTGNAKYVWGAITVAVGGNSLAGLRLLDGSGSGRAAMLSALHGCQIDVVNTSFNGQGIVVGANTTTVSLGNVIGRIYFEKDTNPREIIMMSPFATLEMQDAEQIRFDRLYDLSASRRNDDSFLLQSGEGGAFQYVSLSVQGKRYESQRRGLRYARPNPVPLNSTFKFYQDIGDSLTINLSASAAGLSALMGYNGGEVRRLGSGTDNAPLNPAVINAPPGGTINGEATASIAGKKVMILTSDPANLVWLAGAS